MIRLEKKITLLGLLLMGIVGATFAHTNIDPRKQLKDDASNNVSLRSDCLPGASRFDQQINNVRAALLSSGDVWWDLNTGVYIVPKVQAGTGAKAVSSIFTGGVWLGGKDPAGNLKLAATLFRTGTKTDFWPGPLTENGTTNKATCEKWDKHFVVYRTDIDSLRRLWEKAKDAAGSGATAVIPDGVIPDRVKGWPASRNRFFFEINRFALPVTAQGYGKFHDENANNVYEPDRGDYPTIDVKGCNVDVYPDEMVYWIYNDAGNIHNISQRSEKIQMEIQVQAFGYQTNDELNDMTFQRYKLINRAKTDIDSMYFAMFVDADLGCYTDDYVGCDTSRSLAYYYNQDEEDGTTGIVCDQNVNTYGTKVPIMGIDYFRGPRDANGKELGMSSFTYFNNGGLPGPLAGTTDPATAVEFYNYLTGKWKDGTPYTYGGQGYNPGSTRYIKYAYVDAPDLVGNNVWSMCHPTKAPTTFDRRTIQATGPLLLKPGAVNELIIGVPWVPDQKYPCPSIKRLQEADDIAQALFDNCFKIFDGPTAPDVTWVELENEIIAVLSNPKDSNLSNNYRELYKEPGLKIPRKLANGRPNPDTNYIFEGYKLYQLQNGDVGVADLNNPDKARIVAHVDVQNGISKIVNWKAEDDPNFLGRFVNLPTIRTSNDKGIEHTFKITEDRFASGDNKKLVNHKKYYFTAVAYAYNNYVLFDAATGIGQREPYVEGRLNIGDKNRGSKPYVVTPRPIVDQLLNSKYGDGPQITRLDGIGNGGKYIDITEETLAKILAGTYDGTLTYKPGLGPINVKIYNPIEVVDGNYTLEMRDKDLTDEVLDTKATWILKREGDAKAITSEGSIDKLNEQVIAQYGFSIAIGQVKDAGSNSTVDKKNGAIGSEIAYKDAGTRWFQAYPDDAPVVFPLGVNNTILNYIKNRALEPDFDLDPNLSLGLTNPNSFFVPYSLCDFRDVSNQFYLTPAWVNASNAGVRNNNKLSDLNNVNIVFTKDKTKWSRCAVVETAVPFYYDGVTHPRSPQLETENLVVKTNNRKATNFNLRNAPSVGKDVGADNKPVGQVTAAEQVLNINYGMGWFPGYAVDVETGERLNIFFGENSCFDPAIGNYEPGSAGVNRDMIFNPTTQAYLPTNPFNEAVGTFLGGQHYVYVMKTKYDECIALADRLTMSGSEFRKSSQLRNITWASMILPTSGTKFLSYKDGLIPNDVTITMRVNNPYAPTKGKGTNGNHPAYKFSLTGKQAGALTNQTQIDSVLNFINVAPNPYYGFSAYEINEFATTVKITNLPPKCKVSIYTLDGKFIRQFNRDEKPSPYPLAADFGNRSKQIEPDLEWDLKNDKNIPVSSGVYLINVDAGALGQRTIKFFAVNRQFDPSRL